MNVFLKNKKILFIGPVFYNYHILISDKLKKFGGAVSFFPEKRTGYLFRILNNFSQKLLIKYQNYHYQNIVDRIVNEKFDYLFVVRGFRMPASFIEQVKVNNPGIKTIMYQWDSNRTNPYFNIINSFDRVFSFDYEDCDKESKIKYLPLFCSDDVLEIRNTKTENEYDYFFMGSYLPERYQAFLKVKELLFQQKRVLKLFMYIPKSTYIKEVIKGKKFDKDIVSFYPLSRIDYLRLLNNSSVVIDVSNSGQTGLAMRIIEAIGAGKKILTSNKHIKKECFFNDKRIEVFDSEFPNFSNKFLEESIDNDFNFDQYSLNSWLLTQFK